MHAKYTYKSMIIKFNISYQKGIKMKISFEEKDENIIFRVSDFTPEYEKVLKMCFYQNDGNNYIKTYPQKIKNIEKIKNYYFNNAFEMFSQLGYFKPIPWEKALNEFCLKIKNTGIDWWLTGSCAACIRGIKLNPHDIDIMINSKDVERIADIFSDYIIEPIIDTQGWVTKDFGVLFLHARIDIASDPQERLDNPEPVDCGPYAQNHLETVFWNGHNIKVPPLKLQLYVNKIRNRTDRAALIEKFMNNNS